jgi:hypothetical protein
VAGGCDEKVLMRRAPVGCEELDNHFQGKSNPIFWEADMASKEPAPGPKPSPTNKPDSSPKPGPTDKPDLPRGPDRPDKPGGGVR